MVTSALRSARPVLGLLLAFTALAMLVVAPARADPLDDRVRQVAKQLRCPICESVSVADSPAELAVQMRGIIRKKLEAGETEQQIVDYFVGAYGDSVLLEPPRRGLGWIVWLGPVAVLTVGVVVVSLLLRAWVRPRPARRARGVEASAAANGGARGVGGTALTASDHRDHESAEERYTTLARDELDAARKGLAP